jgi:glycosyltransferase involved in cell wall biosynthesis
LFVYKRDWHTRQTVQSLLENKLSAESELHIFSDGPKNEKDFGAVQKVREYINTIIGFSKVFVYESKKNFGLASSVINGVSKILGMYDKIIVLEDDLVLSKYFLDYMNKALILYEPDERVISVHGYIYPAKGKFPETFFLRGADCWGWATWKRGWKLFKPDAAELCNEIKEKKLVKEFNLNGAFNNYKMLQKQANGKIDSWAIRWHASAFLKDKLTLYPGRSLVNNIGFDEMGTHTKYFNVYSTQLADSEIKLASIPVEENIEAKKEIEKFFRKTKPNLVQKLLLKYKSD